MQPGPFSHTYTKCCLGDFSTEANLGHTEERLILLWFLLQTLCPLTYVLQHYPYHGSIKKSSGNKTLMYLLHLPTQHTFIEVLTSETEQQGIDKVFSFAEPVVCWARLAQNAHDETES